MLTLLITRNTHAARKVVLFSTSNIRASEAKTGQSSGNAATASWLLVPFPNDALFWKRSMSVSSQSVAYTTFIVLWTNQLFRGVPLNLRMSVLRKPNLNSEIADCGLRAWACLDRGRLSFETFKFGSQGPCKWNEAGIWERVFSRHRGIYDTFHIGSQFCTPTKLDGWAYPETRKAYRNTGAKDYVSFPSYPIKKNRTYYATVTYRYAYNISMLTHSNSIFLIRSSIVKEAYFLPAWNSFGEQCGRTLRKRDWWFRISPKCSANSDFAGKACGNGIRWVYECVTGITAFHTEY